MKCKNINLCFRNVALAVVLAATLPQIAKANETAVDIRATVKAVCSLSAPEVVDLGEIPITAFDGKSAGEELSGYNSTFTISTNCSGTDKYVLTFTPTSSADGCLAASSNGMNFCLYDSGNQKIALTATGATLAGSSGSSGEQIKIIPARGTQVPTAGEHKGALTVRIAPD